MAAFGASFESESYIEDRKENKRKSRQEVVEKAKQEYEREEKKKELKRLRGEDTWMLPELNQRLQQIEQEDSLRGLGRGVETVKAWKIPAEAKPAESSQSPAQEAQRDEWMTFDFLAMKTTSTTERRAEKDRLKGEEKAKSQAGLHKLELNPFWKDGGKVASVNDGGLSWLRKSYQRMREQADREQRSLDEISMEEFQKRLADAEEAAYGPPRRGENRDGGGRRWEGRGEQREQFRERENGPSEDRGRYRERERSSDRERGAGYDRVGERRRRSADRDEERPRERERERANDRRRDQDRDRNGDGDRDRDGGRPGAADRPQRDRDRPSRRDDASPGLNRNPPPLDLGSLKGRFLKPSEDEDTSGETKSAPAPAPAGRPKAFMRPSSDDEDSPRTVHQNPRVPNWKRKPDATVRRTPEPEGESEKEATEAAAAAPRQEAAVTSSSDEEEEEELPLLTDEEMNKLGAKLVKAEIMGNAALVEKLKSQMESARKAKDDHETRLKQAVAAKANQLPGRTEEDQELLLFRTDHSGRAWPVNAPSGPQEPRGGRRKMKPVETHVDGERVRYFQDDDGMGLKEMVRREKMSTPQDQNALYSRMAAKMMGKVDGDNYTLDDMFVSSAAQREGEGRDEERMRSQALAESRRLAASMDQCPRCFNSKELQKHLIVAIGTKSYVSLPAGVSMAEGHCLIAPLQHHCSATGLDEDIWSEMQLFRRTLVRMFEAQEMDCVFMETHMNPRRRQHMKAILDCDEEWAMNKKVVNLSSKDIRQAVPRGLPYFAVDFGLQGGFAHVIENEQKFPHYFGKEVVGGMMDLEPRRWRKPIRENFDDQRKKVLQFAQWWKPFDCTKTDA
ncbi:hypothetical protein NHX12_008985 [Muraenolepis orangiensis]|uniref:CWF19-like protein 2 n=1 Tax=Muraenolepis orangiensis TaxID=630683 RepID=A0A9Q0DMF1_9TELE|nr:hypothetical protein NHX12_008985 [Muraenolepis orangiensis]